MNKDWSELQIAVFSNSKGYRKLVQQILLSLGVTNVQTSRIDMGANAPVTKKHDLVVVRLSDEDDTVLDFVRWLRLPQGSPAPGIPVLMAVNTPDRQVLTTAIKAGVDLLVAEPLSIEGLQKRIEAMLATSPKRVTAWNYYGPDRRRSPESFSPYKGQDRRQQLRAAKSA